MATLAAAQAHLFPSEAQAPGAKEINTIDYLRGALNSPGADPEERNFIFAGVAWLRGWAGMPFGDLTEAQREQLMRKMAGSKDGQNWIAVQLYYILEALLSDPVYGGNPDATGWKWLDYVPGFPRPQEGSRYFELLEK